MFVYHYCLTYQDNPGQSYSDGIVRMECEIVDGDGYEELRKTLNDHISHLPEKYAIVSLSLLKVDEKV